MQSRAQGEKRLYFKTQFTVQRYSKDGGDHDLFMYAMAGRVGWWKEVGYLVLARLAAVAHDWSKNATREHEGMAWHTC